MERETDQEEYDRKQQEKADAIRERQIRLGDIPDPNASEEEEPPSSDIPEGEPPQPEAQYTGGEIPQTEPQPN